MDNNNARSSNKNNNNSNSNNNNNNNTQVVESYDDNADYDVPDTLSSDEDDQGPGLALAQGQGLEQGLEQGLGIAPGLGQGRTASIPSVPIRRRSISGGGGNHTNGRIRPSPINTSDRGQGLGPKTAPEQRLARRAPTGDVDRDGMQSPHPHITDHHCDHNHRDNRLGWAQFERLAHLGLPGSLSQFVELGCFELMAIIAAQLGPVPLGK